MKTLEQGVKYVHERVNVDWVSWFSNTRFDLFKANYLWTFPIACVKASRVWLSHKYLFPKILLTRSTFQKQCLAVVIVSTKVNVILLCLNYDFY